MILITGAAGKTGRAVIRFLAAKEQTIRGFVHRSDQVTPLKKIGVHEPQKSKVSQGL